MDIIKKWTESSLILKIIIGLVIADYPSIYEPISSVFSFYSMIIEITFSSIFDTLHSIINIIPSYDTYLTSLTFISYDGLQLMNIFIFNTIVIFIIKMLIFIIKDAKKQDA